MGYNLMVFDATNAPKTREAFMEWVKKQTEWNESHDYNDISVASPALKSWFMEMKEAFPPLNGSYAPTDAQIAEDEDLEAHLTEYSIGYHFIYLDFSWSMTQEAYDLVVELAHKHGVGFYEASSEDGLVIYPPDGVRNEKPIKNPKKIEVQTQKKYLPFNFIRQIIPMTVWINLAITVVLFLMFFIIVGGSLLIYDLTGVDSLGALADNLMELFDELFIHFGTTILIGIILGVIGAGLMAFYFQNIKITVDDEAVSFWRGKKQYRTFSLIDHEIRSYIHQTYHYFIFKTTTRYLTVKKNTGKWRKKYQCFGVSEADFNKLINHIHFDAIPSVEIYIDENIENEQVEDIDFEAYDGNFVCDERPGLREEVIQQLEETEEYSPFPTTFNIDKEAYIKNCKKEIASNFTALLFIPAVAFIFMLILGVPFYLMADILYDSLFALIFIFGIILIFIALRNLKLIMLIREIRTTTPTVITIDETRLRLKNDDLTDDYLLANVKEIRVTPPNYQTTDKLYTIRRHLTITTTTGVTKRFLLGDAQQTKWFNWLNFKKSKKNVFEDYATFCQILQIRLADENDSRFKLELE